jgi:hypothetical protein
VIAGVIDTGIPLGHPVLRDRAGRSRVLAAWQQTAASRGQPGLPFGRELHAGGGPNGIDALLARHTRGGRLDEIGFNREAGLVEPTLPMGHRDLDYRSAHGAHVADLAAGCDPEAEPDFASRVRLIVVNLPPQYLHGPAGNFLDAFAGLALRRIAELADALWARDHGACKPDGRFPLAINLSYGMQAGPRDGTMALERVMADLASSRPAGAPPLRIQLPAGNANQARCTAPAILAAGDPAELPWRIQPGDRTSNHLEIWTPPTPAGGRPGPGAYRIAVAPPGLPPLMAPPLAPGRHVDLGRMARLHCHVHAPVPGGPERLFYLLSVAPTYHPDPRFAPRAPAGLWRVFVHGPEGARIERIVQSDQALVVHSRQGRASYLDHPNYRRHRAGAPSDSLAHGVGPRGAVLRGEDAGEGPVTRFGTLNAIASGESVTVAASHRATDGRPASYSATARLRGGGGAISASFAAEDGVAHPGVLAAGSAAGSRVWYSGTSMACAMATRRVLRAMLDGSVPDPDAAWLAAEAARAEAGRGGWAPIRPAKSGAGRLDAPSRPGRRPVRRL